MDVDVGNKACKGSKSSLLGTQESKMDLRNQKRVVMLADDVLEEKGGSRWRRDRERKRLVC